MTQSNTTIEPTISSAVHPNDVLMNLIVSLLAPMFLVVSGGNVSLARMAATETVSAYCASTHADLIAIAQIIGFGLAALGSLSQSMADDISPSMALRLRGNANALARSAEQNRRSLRRNHSPGSADAAAAESVTRPKAAVSEAVPAPLLVTLATERLQTDHPATLPDPADPAKKLAAQKRHQQMWAIAMVKEAGEITASIPSLPQSERQAATIRAAALGSTAHELLTGASLPPQPPQDQTSRR